MNASEIAQYVVTFRYREKGLTDLLELTSTLTNGGFTTSLTDGEGHAHELGTNSFGFVSVEDEATISEKATKLGELALGQTPDVQIQRWEAFLQDNKH